ncbi:MAG: aminoglycoside phosphotransferase family protein [Propionibacteriaceae bacterium]|nr:aminoglycoside phosphotransferase family protein [Propionibacteriaceae bacterium]
MISDWLRSGKATASITALAPGGEVVVRAVTERVESATLAGHGETYDVWRLELSPGEDDIPTTLGLRVIRRDLATVPRSMGDEFAALLLAPEEVAPRAWAMSEGTNPPDGEGAERPWMLVSFAPGAVKAPSEWTTGDLTAHARGLARLHDRRYPGRGPIRALIPEREDEAAGGALSSTPTGTMPAALTPLSLVDELEQALAWWNTHHPEITGMVGLRALTEQVRRFVAARSADFEALHCFSLIHGDAVASNIVFDGERPWYIDWEWAEIGDVAKDLALIGGFAHGGQWYVPMERETIASFVNAYADAVGIDGDERASLHRRRDAWEAFDRLTFVLHCQLKAAEPGADPVYADTAESLSRTLGAAML